MLTPVSPQTIILMHGFPDNLHLYDRLVRYLSPPRAPDKQEAH